MAVPSLRALCGKNGGPSDDVTENPFPPSSRAFYCRMICQYTSAGIQYLHAALQRHAAAVSLSPRPLQPFLLFFFSPFPLVSPERLLLMFPRRSCFTLRSIFSTEAAAVSSRQGSPGRGQEVCTVQHSTDTLSNAAAQLTPVACFSAVWLRCFSGE